MEERKQNSLREVIKGLEAEGARRKARQLDQAANLQKMAEESQRRQLEAQIQHFDSKIKPALENRIQHFVNNPIFSELGTVLKDATELINEREGDGGTIEPKTVVYFYRQSFFNNGEGKPDFVFEVNTKKWTFNPNFGTRLDKLQARVDFEYKDYEEHTDYNEGHYTEGHCNRIGFSFYPQGGIKINERVFDATKANVEVIRKTVAESIRTRQYHQEWFYDWNDGPDTGGNN